MKRILIFIVVFSMGFSAWAEPGPGDIFREYKWRPEGKWQRVTGPDATAEGAKIHLPNSVNTIRIDDLDGAVKVEAYIEMLLCHGGTVNKRIRVDANPWMPIPESSLIPGKAGQGPPNSEYQYMRYPCVRIPMEYLRQGNNTFEFTCSPGTSLGGRWPQWILYGVTFRVYYNGSKPHPTGKITEPSCGSTIRNSPVLGARATGPNPIKQVDFIGLYEDFNWQGDGNYRQWQYRYLYNEIKNHIGTAVKKPYKVIWNNSWIPTQNRPIKIMARIIDTAGMCYMTSPVENIHLVRNKTVRMYKPYDVPKRWSTRVGNTHKCKTDVDEDLSKAVAAKIIMTTWNGVAADEIGINDKKVVTRVGKNHDLSYDEFDVPLNLIKSGTNTLYTHSTTTHHGIEVQWPGMVLMVTYNEPESKRQTANWKFREIIVADIPSHPAFITDCTIVDINGDGRPDLWYSARKGNRKDEDHFIPWYENTGDIKLWTKHLPFAGPVCYGTWGDIDGDGDMDLIASKDRRREVLWMENPLAGGNGKLQQRSWKIWLIERAGSKDLDPDEIYTFYRGADNRIHHNLDLNGDGRLDFVDCTYDGATHYVPAPVNPKTSDGGWNTYEIGGGRGTGSLGDLDGDGDIDLATSNAWYANPSDPTRVPWPKHEYQGGDYQLDGKVEVGDIDGNGRLDVAVSSEEYANGVVWYRNPGCDATQEWKQNVVVPRNSGWEGMHTLQLADFDRDGDLDVLTAEMHNRGKARVAVCENANGKGDAWQVHVISKVGTHNAKVADLDGDGDIDIAGKNFKDDQRPRIWINEISPKMRLDKWRRHVISGDGAPMKGYHIFAADFNGDGRKDIATGDAWYENPYSPGGNWKRHGLNAKLGRIIAVFDFDADGDVDILGGGFGWARNNGASSFEVLTNIAAKGGFVQGAAVGSLRTGDGGLSVIYTYKNGDHVRRLDIPADPVSARWTDSMVYDWAGRSKDIDAGDIDRDGDLDIMFVGRDADTLKWLSNNSDGTFTAHTFAGAPSPIVHRCKLVDIDGDGKLDVLTGSKGQKLTWFKQGSSPTGAWTENTIAGPGTLDYDPLSIDAADMDCDGDTDVVAGEHSPPKPDDCCLFIFENSDGAGGNWSVHLIHKGDEHHQGTQVVDIDDDGDLDIISVGWTHSRVMLYENKVVAN